MNILKIVVLISVFYSQEVFAINNYSFSAPIITQNTECKLYELAAMDSIPYNDVYHLSVNYEFLKKEWLEIIGKLENLESLRIDFYPKNKEEDSYEVKIRKEIRNLENLKTIHISVDSVEVLPDFFSGCKHLTALNISGSQVNEFPKSIGEMNQLVSLSIRIGNIGVFTNYLGRLTNLKKLIISAEIIKELPTSFGYLPSLESLELSLKKNEFIPNIWHGLTNLNELVINGPNLKEIKGDMSELSTLRWLKLKDIYKLEMLPDSIGLLPIYGLDIAYAHKLKVSGNLMKSTTIETLKLIDVALTNFVQIISQISSIEVLTVSSIDVEKLTNKELRFLKSIPDILIDRIYKKLDGGQYSIFYHDLSEIEQQRILDILPNAQY
ncbi:leucine-rich repeat domain-containing protein [Crocinitomix catalasitica]|uniref:leucine-rich repeat domain-containing protein n=1 Tax=Crocinitomix catalasitica TaxID=184607 RepID=UPI0012F74553|nr:hypothetical protein [Crocinitomix catalasitica]